ncbi:unnamed protein product [Phaeothamnion confervicola]
MNILGGPFGPLSCRVGRCLCGDCPYLMRHRPSAAARLEKPHDREGNRLQGGAAGKGTAGRSVRNLQHGVLDECRSLDESGPFWARAPRNRPGCKRRRRCKRDSKHMAGSRRKTQPIFLVACIFSLLALVALPESLAVGTESEDGERRSVGVDDPLPPRYLLDARDPEVVKASQWAVGELQKLSDSGIYTTLSLKRVAAASAQEGVFHFNIFMTLELASPYFASGRKTESYELMVMRHFEDDVLSLAIDEFPTMDPDAVEEFWIETVERRRAERDVFFAELEAEAATAAEAEAAAVTAKAVAARREAERSVGGLGARELLGVALDESVPAARRAAAREVLGAMFNRAAAADEAAMEVEETVAATEAAVAAAEPAVYAPEAAVAAPEVAAEETAEETAEAAASAAAAAAAATTAAGGTAAGT